MSSGSEIWQSFAVPLRISCAAGQSWGLMRLCSLMSLKEQLPSRYSRNADHFDRIAASVIESSDQQRPTIIRELYKLDPERAASYLNMVLQGATQEERQQIGAALQKSGLIDDAIENLTGSNHSNSYRAFSLLFLIAKAGTFEPLMRVIEDHPNIELRLALIRLLGSSGAPGLPRELKRLLTKKSMPAQLSLAIRE